ncbi:MAG: VCBS repeat-containing protein [Saprospiraceae bacterium]|nr:VCBS repeat-containing protein [Saprospiraceae bacterium]
MVILLVMSCDTPNQEMSFTQLESASTGITFANTLEETHAYNYFTYPYLYLGGGVAIGDINNDGLEDVFFTGNMVPNKLYLNKGDLQFEDITLTAGVAGDKRWYSGVAMADVNEDGFLDLYCSVGGKNGPNQNQLFINNGDNTFTDQAKAYGLDCDGLNMHAAFLDYDLDGDLDLYVVTYPPTSFAAPVQYYHYMLENHPPEDSDRLYRNDNGRFVDVTEEAGVRNFGLSLGLVVSDLNGDRYPDIFVSNDFNAPDYLFINNQDGTFTNRIDTCLQQTSFFGMGADAADFNNDGHIDLFQLDMSAEDNFRSKANMSSMDPEAFYTSVDLGLHHQYMQNSLQMNHGSSGNQLPMFSNVARLAGVSSTDWSWGGLLADFDNDGAKDLFVSNGIRRDVNNKDFYAKYRSLFDKLEKDPDYEGKEEEVGLLNILEELPSERLSNYMFRNDGEMSFENVAEAWGLGEKTFSNGIAYGDLDNDGDLDLVVNNLEGDASIYRNNGSGNNFLDCSLSAPLEGLRYGAVVQIETLSGNQLLEYSPVRGYLSSVSPRLHFGLGDQDAVRLLTVRWSDGAVQQMNDVPANQVVQLRYEDASIPSPSLDKESNTLFHTTAWSDPPRHTENAFNDFEKEVLLPHKNSTLGPTLAVADFNGDGLDDFIMGGAIGQPSLMHTQQADGSFELQKIKALAEDRYHEDLGILPLDADQDGDVDLFVTSGGNEFPAGSKGYQDRFYENLGNGAFQRRPDAIPDIRISTQPAAQVDIDKDGDLDIFVGGRLVPGRYPYPTDSYILINESEEGEIKFRRDDRNDEVLKELGLVTAAVWLDADGDGWQDLILSGEWMPIRLFKNNNGVLQDRSAESMPEQTAGWWFSLAKGDFDGDGDEDLIGGNLGQNYKYQASPATPFKIYLNDFDRNSTADIVLSYQDGETEYPVRGRQCSSEQMPAIKMKFEDYNSFASATLRQIYTTQLLEESISYEVTSFSSKIFINDGGTFRMRDLPPMAQMTSCNQLLVSDFNADGHLDVLMAGNLYNAEVETPRNDAGYGLFLAGDGNGSFQPVPMNKSGLCIIGDVRGMRELQVAGQRSIAVAKNDDAMQMVGIAPGTHPAN